MKIPMKHLLALIFKHCIPMNFCCIDIEIHTKYHIGLDFICPYMSFLFRRNHWLRVTQPTDKGDIRKV